MNTSPTIDTARKVLSVLDHGLSSGLGKPEPGKMCVEAAVCYALGMPHGDNPSCVLPALRTLKIHINDAKWSSNKARADGLRRLGIAQLGSEKLDSADFVKRVSTMTIRVFVPIALRAAASRKGNAAHKDKLLAAADLCEKEPTRENARKAREVANAAAYAAYAAAYAAAADAAADAAYAAAYAAATATAAAADAAYAAATATAADAAYAAADAAAVTRDSILASFCEHVVGILIEMEAPGCAYLHLTIN